ncbi:YciI family protein [Actinoplanes sp. NPDC051411]|uniref:YciI family protein n=1 Tax=Actinoplanes sp. NPDC051411 TaxID=3155522 RepID=UPI003443F4E7
MISTYTVPLEEVDKLRDAHLAFLDEKEAAGLVVSAGRQDPPNGGVVILDVASEAEAFAVMADDPYLKGKVGEYKAVGFNPSRGVLQGWTPAG